MIVHLNAVAEQAATRQSSIKMRDQAKAVVQSPLGQALPLKIRK